MNPDKFCELIINVDKDNCILQQQPNHVDREVMHPLASPSLET